MFTIGPINFKELLGLLSKFVHLSLHDDYIALFKNPIVNLIVYVGH